MGDGDRDEAGPSFVSRGGGKLDHALSEFGVEVDGLVCADFGCNVGGFTDCLLQRGASRVYAIDTGYGALAWTIRNDPRVVVLERTNALHLDPATMPRFDLIVIDLAWTPQRLAVPAALRLLGPAGRLVSLVKPHYELDESEKRTMLRQGVLSEDDAQSVFERTVASLGGLGVEVRRWTRSPVRGGKSSRGRADAGNVEYLVLLEPVVAPEGDRR